MSRTAKYNLAIAATKLASTKHDANLVERLGMHSPVRDEAIAQLRDYLICGLLSSLAHWYQGEVRIEDVVEVALLNPHVYWEFAVQGPSDSVRVLQIQSETLPEPMLAAESSP